MRTTTFVPNMEEAYVTFEQAKALKELGFPQNIKYTYNDSIYFDDGNLVFVCDSGDYEDEHNVSESYICPTQSLTQRWLREANNMHISVSYEDDYCTDADGNICDRWEYFCVFVYINHKCVYGDMSDDQYETYEEALSVGIDRCIEILKMEQYERKGH